MQVLLPDCCKPLMQPETRHEALIRFNLKHAVQQASIIGHMDRVGALRLQGTALCDTRRQPPQPPTLAPRAGLLRDSAATCFVEYGAGKAYLTLMVAEAVPARAFVVMDSAALRMKADRTLRKLGVCFVRCRLNIKDFAVAAAIKGVLASSPERDQSTANASDAPATAPATAQASAPQPTAATPFVAIGKHLCGAATDFTLRSALSGCAGKGWGAKGQGMGTERLVEESRSKRKVF